jgi:hypothetical protein
MVRGLGTHGIRHSKGYEPVIAFEIAILVLAGLLLFATFLKILIQGPSRTAPDASAVVAVGQMVALQGVSFTGAERLLDGTEFRMISSTAALRPVAKSFRKSRQQLALLWISLLLSDVYRLWRFRRFLVSNGVSATFGEEAQILGTAILAIAFLNFARVLVRVAGPFALSGAARNAQRLVERMSDASARVLDRMPRNGWPELQRSWQKSVA